MGNGRSRSRGNCGGQRGGKDKARRKAAQKIHHRGRASDIAANASKRFAQSAFDQGDPVHQAAFLGDATTARAVHANGVDLIDIGHRTVLFADIKDLFDGGDIAVH